jgi:hypothetical protein
MQKHFYDICYAYTPIISGKLKDDEHSTNNTDRILLYSAFERYENLKYS